MFKKLMCRLLLAATTLSVGLSEPDETSQMKWPLHRLVAESDVVLFGRVTGFKETGRTETFADWKGFKFAEYLFSVQVLATLKGKVGYTIKLRHYFPPHNLGPNAPGKLWFPTGRVPLGLEGQKVDGRRLEYIFFLSRNKDRTFDPVTGHHKASLSVRLSKQFVFNWNWRSRRGESAEIDRQIDDIYERISTETAENIGSPAER